MKPRRNLVLAAPLSHPPRVAARTASPALRQLFDILRERRINLKRFAQKTGYTAATISYWKSGRTEPRINDLEAALSILGLEVRIVDIDTE
ncbi:MAG: XRE family transcriptional regulator [Mesorhizobium sp.]|nr:MAG: XRE family transcriptional regulator [Mesorhizobium sp.]